jgi:hypothetical protein
MGQMTHGTGNGDVLGESMKVGSRRMRVRALVLAGAMTSLGAVAVLGAGASSAAGPVATAARTLNLNESGRLHLTSSHGFKLNEQGSASGSIRGSIYIHLQLHESNRVTAEVNIYPSSGSLTGNGSASYGVSPDGADAVFSGTLSISRGSGRYAHAHATRLRFTGTIQRKTDAVTVRLSGPLSY